MKKTYSLICLSLLNFSLAANISLAEDDFRNASYKGRITLETPGEEDLPQCGDLSAEKLSVNWTTKAKGKQGAYFHLTDNARTPAVRSFKNCLSDFGSDCYKTTDEDGQVEVYSVHFSSIAKSRVRVTYSFSRGITVEGEEGPETEYECEDVYSGKVARTQE